MKEITINTEYITLGQFLKFSSIICDGGEAKMFLANEKVLVNGEIENRRGKKLFKGYIITVKGIEYKII